NTATPGIWPKWPWCKRTKLLRSVVMSKRAVVGVLVAIAAVAVSSPVFAQEAAAGLTKNGAHTDVVAMWSIITAGFALAIAAFGGALGQGKAIASAAEGIARNPSAAG